MYVFMYANIIILYGFLSGSYFLKISYLSSRINLGSQHRGTGIHI